MLIGLKNWLKDSVKKERVVPAHLEKVNLGNSVSGVMLNEKLCGRDKRNLLAASAFKVCDALGALGKAILLLDWAVNVSVLER